MIETSVINQSQPENQQIPERTGVFILSLLQAFLRTGYYLPGHPEAHKAKAGLYEIFVKVAALSGEISFLVVEEHGRRTIAIEGAGPKTLKLQNIMQRGIAETYTPKFIQFMQRKELLALSLNVRMDADEFSHFIDVMSEPLHADMRGKTAKEQFIQALRDRHICNISFIFNEEFITDRHNVPWRTRMALSRLKKDLHLLPIFRNLEESELHRIKLQILTDLLRPLGVAELIYSFLINLDLAASSLLSEEDGEHYVFSLTNDRLMIAVGNLFIRDLLAVPAGFPEHVTILKKGRILAGLSQRLNSSKESQAGTMLERLFNNGLIPLEALPEALRTRVLTIKRVATFLMKPDTFLKSVDRTTEPDVYSFRAQTLISFVPYLLERGKIQEAIAIVELINSHAEENSGRSASAVQRRSELVFGDTLPLASKIFLTASKETRTLIGRLFQIIGYGAIPHLQQILIESDDPWRSKQAAEALISMGDKAVAGIITAIDCKIFSKTSIPVVLRTVSELSDSIHKREIVRLLLSFGASGHLETRREALAGLSRISPFNGYSLFCARLTDQDLRIRKIAVRGLGLAGDRRAVELFAAIVEKAEKTHQAEDLELAVVAVESLGVLTESCLVARTVVIPYLGSLVDRYCSGGSWKNILPGAFVPPVYLLLALTETIGKQVGPTAHSYLARLSHHSNPDVAKRAGELFNKTP